MVLKPLGFLLAGLAIGDVLARFLNPLARRRGRNQTAVEFPPASEAEREWRLRIAGVGGTSRTAP